MADSKIANMPKLERSSLETYAGIILGLLGTAIPMTWWLRCSLLALAAGFLIDGARRATWTDKWNVGLRIGLAVLAIVTLAAVSWGSVQEEYQKQRGDGSFAPSIFIECHFGLMPKILPPEGPISVLALMPVPVEDDGGSISQRFSEPGAASIGLAPNGLPKMTYRCQLTNYWTVPLSNVTIKLKLDFIEVIKDKRNPPIVGAKIVLSREQTIDIPKIDAGSNFPFVFYIENSSPYFTSFSFSERAFAWLIGSNDLRPIKLMQQKGAPLTPLPPIMPIMPTRQPSSSK
jgi:hypothetical protein